MLLQGKFKLENDVETVWMFVSDPAKVIECAPGLQNYTVGEGKRVSASVKVKIGFISSVFQTNSKMTSEDPAGHSASLELTGSGSGSAFHGVVGIRVTGSSSSEVAWEANMSISGPLGSLARPLIEGNVRKIVDQLFDCVKRKLS